MVLNSSRVFLAFLALHSVAFADCQIPTDGSVFVRIPVGNVVLDTSGATTVEVSVSNPAIQLEEACFDDHVEIGGEAPERVYGPVDWTIRVPSSVDLDVVTLAGSIRIANSDGNVTARTTGGSVIVGNIGGEAAMATQGGSILAGNIGGNAELRSEGGTIEIGNVTGNAEIRTAGPIRTGTISGQILAETDGGTIEIQESHGDLTASTLAGDILIGTSQRTTVETGGGNIVGLLIHGPFQGSSDIGNIRLERAESSIEATTGNGDIEVRFAPLSPNANFQVALETSSGNILLEIPETLTADVEATVLSGASLRQYIRSDFPLRRVDTTPNLPSFSSQTFVAAPLRSITTLNGGGSQIKLQTTRGTIEILRDSQ